MFEAAKKLPRENRTVFVQETATHAGAAAVASGWDPYEVWRTRVFVPQPNRYKGGRGNSKNRPNY